MQQPIYSAAEEMELMARLWSPSIKDDPLAFVLLAFPWGERGTPLEHFDWPAPLAAQHPGRPARPHPQNNGKIDFDTFRMAVASGRGIGKSALVSWLVIWMLSTRIGGSVIVSANSEAQLRSVTWAEITKWLAMSLNSHWFEISRHAHHAGQVADGDCRARPQERHALLVHRGAAVVGREP
jgi:hypothetical protein